MGCECPIYDLLWRTGIQNAEIFGGKATEKTEGMNMKDRIFEVLQRIG